MPTRPKNDPVSIAQDARRVLAVAREDQSVTEFAARIGAQELDAFLANIDALSAGDGARSAALHDQVSAGVHAARARAQTLFALRGIRDDAKLKLADRALQRGFGVGATPSPGSTAEVRHLVDEVLQTAAAHPTEAAEIGLDAAGIHALEDLAHALDGADVAHVQSAQHRHEERTVLDSLAHAVVAEAAHIRLAARRVFRADPAKLARYGHTLPRHAVVPRATPPTG